MGKPRSKRKVSDEGGAPPTKRQNKSNKKRKQGSTKPQSKKKRRKSSGGRYWIEDCKETKPKTGEPALTVIITRVELTDNHMHTPNDSEQPGDHTQSDRDTKTAVATGSGSLSPGVCAGGEDGKERNEDEKQNDDETHAVSSTSLVAANDKSDFDSTTSDQTKSKETPVAAPSEDKQPTATAQSSSGTYNQSTFISVQRAESAKHAPKKNPFYIPDYKPLPNGDCGDGIVNPFPKSEVADKYWAQRRRLFSRFDEGIQLDREGWYSVTPEVIANHIAKKMIQETVKRMNKDNETDQREGIIVLDAFCGCGGNAIAFAKRPEVSLVVCVDTDRSKLLKAANNASIYRIPSTKIVFLEADACQVLTSYEAGKKRPDATDTREIQECHGYKIGGLNSLPEHLDIIFLSPPWGGVDYGTVGRRNFDLATCIKVSSTTGDEEKNGQELLSMAASAVESRLVVYFLPRNANGISLGRHALEAGYQGAIELEQNLVNGKFKTVTAYLGFDVSDMSRDFDKSEID